MKQYVILFGISIGIIISSTIVFLIPGSLELFGFSGQYFLDGQIWRLFTFPFSHLSLNHLIENVMALMITSLLAYEFGLRGKFFLGCFLLTGIAIALIEALMFPAILIAGASLGTYAVLGSLSIKGSNFIPKYILIPVLGSTIFIMYAVNAFTCMECITTVSLFSVMFHFSGFIGGISIFYVALWMRPKKRILGNL